MKRNRFNKLTPEQETKKKHSLCIPPTVVNVLSLKVRPIRPDSSFPTVFEHRNLPEAN